MESSVRELSQYREYTATGRLVPCLPLLWEGGAKRRMRGDDCRRIIEDYS